jgi:predicted DCC family thiol-disulfide oxidoreductase YuxK
VTLLLYDGACGLCAASVQFILRHERRQTLQFAPLQGDAAAQLRARHPELAGVDSMVWVDGFGDPRAEHVEVRADAVMRAASYLGGPWALAAIGRFVPAKLRNALYDLVARHRHQLFAPPEQCYLPSPDTRARFLA